MCLIGCEVREAAVRALAVVNLHCFIQYLTGFFDVCKNFIQTKLCFQYAVDTLCNGILVRVAFTAHGDADAPDPELLGIIITAILYTPVAVVDKGMTGRVLFFQCLIKRSYGPFGREITEQTVAYYFPAKGIGNKAQVSKAFLGADVGDVAYP